MARYSLQQVRFVLIVFSLAPGCLFGLQGLLALDSGSAIPGGTISLNLNFTPSGAQPAGLEWTFSYSSSDIVAISVVPGAASVAAGKSVSCAGSGSSYTCLAVGINSNTIATLTLAPTVSSTFISIANPLAATLSGGAYSTVGLGGLITTSQPILVSALQCASAALIPNASTSCTVTLNRAAPAGGLSIGLGTTGLSALTVPSLVTIASNSSTGTFTVSSGNFSSSQAGSLMASYNGSAQSVSFTLNAPTVVSTLHCTSTTLASNASSACTVTLSTPAPAGGAMLSLSSTLAGLLALPQAAVVAANSSTGTFTIFSLAILSNQAGLLTVTYNGSSQSVILTLNAPVSALQCSPTTLASNASGTCTVTLGTPAPAGGAVLTLSSTPPGLLGLPRAAVVAANSSTGAFSIFSLTISSSQTVSLTATYQGSSQSVALRLSPSASVSSLSLSCTSTSLVGGDATPCTVSLPQAASGGGLSVRLTSDNPRIHVPATVHVPDGKTTAAFTLDSQLSDHDESGTIQASVNDALQTKKILLRGTKLASLTCTPKYVRAGDRVDCEVSLNSVPKGGSVPLGLSSSSTDVKLPVLLATRRGQPALVFQAVIDPASHAGLVSIEAGFGTNTVRETLMLSSKPGPVLTVPQTQIAKSGDTIRFSVSASDPNGLPLSLEASELPAGASFDSFSGHFEWTPSDFHARDYEVAFTARNSANVAVTKHVRIEVDSGLPVISGLVNGASGNTDLAVSPRAVVALVGKWLSSSSASDPSGNSLELAGTRVKINGDYVPVLHAGQTRVDFLSPNVASGSQLEIVLETATGATAPIKTAMLSATPGIFSLDGSGQGEGLVYFSGTDLIATTRDFRAAGQPAQPGDELSIRATGLESAHEHSVLWPSVRFGDTDILAESVNAVAGSAGVFEVKIRVPEATSVGRIPVAIEIPQLSGIRSNTAWIAIEGLP